MKALSCSIRTRKYAGTPMRLEVGAEIANALTSVTKDSMVLIIYDRNPKEYGN